MRQKAITNIETQIKNFLKNHQKITIMGIGNELRTDDALGPKIIEKLKQKIQKPNINLINAGTVPENFTGKIKKDNPTHIIIIDAVLMNKQPGHIQIIKKEEIKNTNTSTHSLSLNYLIKYLEQEKTYKILFIGIQPKNLELGIQLSPEIEKATQKIEKILIKNL